MASPRRKGECSKRAKREKKEGWKGKMPALKLADVMCPVCLCILIEPVTMPCNHNLCMPCFHQNVEETSLLCPICRKRISSWSRKASRENSLINKELWTKIQNAFPDKVKRRQLGKESEADENDDDEEEMIGPPVRISKPGEIRMEYETQLKRLQEEDEKDRERENQQSSALIEKIQEEEERLKVEAQRQAEKDHIIAMLINEQIQEVPVVKEAAVIHNVLTNIDEVLRPATVCTLENKQRFLEDSRRTLSSCTIPTQQNLDANDKKLSGKLDNDVNCEDDNKRTTRIDETPGKYTGKLSRSNSLDSEDSITPELRHFRPIKTAPKTPPLRLPDGRIQETPLIHATPRAIVFDALLCEPDRHGLLRKRLNSIEEDRRRRVEGNVNTNQTESHSVRKVNRFRPLAPFSTSPGNCALGTKPEKTYALSDQAANKENPKAINKKRKLQDNSARTEVTKKCKGMLGHGDIYATQKLLLKSQATKRVSKSQPLKSRPAKLTPSRPHISEIQSQLQDPNSEERIRQEEADRLLALEIHRKLNWNHNTVDRRIGTKGEYYLRSRDNEVSFRFLSTAKI